MMFHVLWKNLVHDRLRFAIAVAGIGFSAFLMTLQADLLYGFTQAASRIIDAADGGIWIMPRGVPCFDYAASMPGNVRELALGVPGVHSAGRVASGFAMMQRPDGLRQAVLVVGIDEAFAGTVPSPSRLSGDQPYWRSAKIDVSDAPLFGFSSRPVDVEIASRHARVNQTTQGFASFLGSPFLFAAYTDALEYLSTPAEKTMFIIVKVMPGADAAKVHQALRTRLPEFDVWTTPEFSQRARMFWLIQTGAGGALLLAATLGFLIGLAVVSQTIYASTMNHLDEFATLKALGASKLYVQGLVLGQAYLCGLIGGALGFLAVSPAVNLARDMITWIEAPLWMFGVTGALLILLCSAAALVAVQPALKVEPGRVFRA